MKKIILLALTALMMVGCNKNDLRGTVASIKNKEIKRDGVIVNIDSCQYIVCDAYGGWAYIHHNNCKFCKERRQKEMEELAIKLKEK